MQNVTGENSRAAVFIDIDGTLIYSHRREYRGDRRWVEYINGKRQAYIPVEAEAFLKKLDIEIIPVTSRNPEQLKRITGFLRGLGVKRCLIYNGAVLVDIDDLFNRKKTVRFNLETLERCEQSAADMERALNYVYQLNKPERLHVALPQYISGVFKNSVSDINGFISDFKDSSIYAYREANKFYILPKAITKGAQVERFSDMFGIGYKICAGDSLNDISMLKIADLSFCPEGIVERFEPKGERAVCGEPVICGVVRELKMRSKEINKYK